MIAASAAAGPVIPNFGGGGTSSCLADNGFFCPSWVSDHWSDVLWPALREHIVLSIIAVGIGFVIALALALVAHRQSRFELPITAVTGLLFTIPSLALFQLLVPATGLTKTSAEIALVSYTLLILFRNTLLGLRGVPDDVREAARGMGYTSNQLLWKVELPLALPAIVAGLRIATVTVISLATIAAYIAVPSLGAPIFSAIANSVFKTELVAAGALAILLALFSDGLLLLVQRLITPWSRATARA